MDLSKTERLILYNQYEILEKLSSDDYDKKHYKKCKDILANGYSRNYYIFLEHIGDECDQEIMDSVYDILEMFRSLSSSFMSLSVDEKTEIDRDKIRFQGFDGNGAGHYSYARFIIEDLGLYEESRLEDYNTHYPIEDYYFGMLNKWKKIVGPQKYRKLSKNEINIIIS